MHFTDAGCRRLLGLLLVCLIFANPGSAQEQQTSRKVITKVVPAYPETARHMNITGTVKLQVIIAANGSVKIVKPFGGHPLLIDSAVAAMKEWKYEPGGEEIIIVEFKFPPGS